MASERSDEIRAVIRHVIDCTFGLKSWAEDERRELVDRIMVALERNEAVR